MNDPVFTLRVRRPSLLADTNKVSYLYIVYLTEYCSQLLIINVIFPFFFSDGCGDDEAAAEGAHLGLWAYDFLKSKKESLKSLKIKPLDEGNAEQWQVGVKKAKGQNFARTLMETPSNHLTPQIFARVSHFLFLPNFVRPLNCIFML